MKLQDGLSGSSGDCWIVGNQIVSTSFTLRSFRFIFVCVVESLIFSLFGNSAKDFTGVVPLSAPGEDQRKSAQRVSPLLLFTSIFHFQQIYTVDAYRYGEIFRLLCFTPGCPSVFWKKPWQDAGVTRESFLAELQDEDEQTGELQLKDECYRGGSSSMGSSSGLSDFAGRQGGKWGERKDGWAWQSWTTCGATSHTLCAHQGEDVRHCVHRTKAPHRVHVSAVLLQSRSLESPWRAGDGWKHMQWLKGLTQTAAHQGSPWAVVMKGKESNSPLLSWLHAYWQRCHGCHRLCLLVLALLCLHQGVAHRGGVTLEWMPILACGRGEKRSSQGTRTVMGRAPCSPSSRPSRWLGKTHPARAERHLELHSLALPAWLFEWACNQQHLSSPENSAVEQLSVSLFSRI